MSSIFGNNILGNNATLVGSSSSTAPSIFPPLYDFPPFFTRYPNASTWTAQRAAWSSLILAYCKAHKLWQLHLSDALETELFHNAALGRRLKHQDAVEVLEFMAKEGQVDWIDESNKTGVNVWWKKPEEWGSVIFDWIDSTGQKGSVLTLYEIAHGDLTTAQEFHGMEEGMLKKALGVLVKRGSAQIFGSGEEMGVKFF
ncbi:ESCRT-II complex subunit-domain-containing protein [Sphaerosporella brunnea]|uniref:Vacuolar protein-sorting-associated protein 25 n=1 Tax=Sphaerosporella brunnea TaxID=1250544 RepID=A0A5J5EL49_9PEZI|nr:ESCRT-II complex subunit-domain-containing protein [Sphaerosporella brunnea]